MENNSLLRDGFDGKDFHRQCDNKGPTVTIIQSNKEFLFGGYTSESWAGKHSFKKDPYAFIFTLTNPHSLPPTQYTIKPEQVNYGMCCYPAHGATFGGGKDIFVSSSSDQNNSSYTNFPYSFMDTTGKGNSTFTNSLYFSTRDIEVYSVI